MYDYLEEMKKDIKDYLEENDLSLKNYSREELEEKLNEDLWTEDSVTGNASGSYYCNAYKAEEAISHNWDLLGQAMSEFGCEANMLEKGPEWCDVTIRCYLLGQAISEVLDELEDQDEDFERSWGPQQDDDEEE